MMVTIPVKFTIGEECSIHLMIRDTYEIVVEKNLKGGDRLVNFR